MVCRANFLPLPKALPPPLLRPSASRHNGFQNVLHPIMGLCSLYWVFYPLTPPNVSIFYVVPPATGSFQCYTNIITTGCRLTGVLCWEYLFIFLHWIISFRIFLLYIVQYHVGKTVTMVNKRCILKITPIITT